MDDSKAALIEEEDEATSPDNKSTSSGRITVEPVLILIAISSTIQSTVLGQYLYYAVGRQYNLTSVNQTKAYQCSPNYNTTEETGDEKELVDKLQHLTSMWTMYTTIGGGIASLIVLPFLSPMTDRLGRKWALKLVVFADLVQQAIITSMIIFSWPLYILVITSTLFSLTGGGALAAVTAFSYLADLTTSKNRPFRITLAECATGLPGVVTSIVVGFWLKHVSYQWPYVLAMGVTALNLIYIFFLLPEVRGRHMEIENTFEIKRIFKAYTATGRNTGSMAFAVLGFFIFCIQINSGEIEEQFVMGLPFCWSSVRIGIFFGVRSSLQNIGMIFAAGIFTKLLGLHSLTLAMIGIASSVASKVMVGLAANSIELFCSIVLYLFCVLPMPMMRSHLSLEVDEDEQGAIFASISMIEIISSLFSATATNLVYQKTLAWFPGFVFLVLAGLGVVSFAMNAASFLLHCKAEKKKQNQLRVHTNINTQEEINNEIAVTS